MERGALVALDSAPIGVHRREAVARGRSDAYYIDGSLGGVLGGADRVGLLVSLDGRWHSGLPFTTALVRAPPTTVATLGVRPDTSDSRCTASTAFDTGVSHTTGYGGSAALSFSPAGAHNDSRLRSSPRVGRRVAVLVVLAVACAEKPLHRPSLCRLAFQVTTTAQRTAERRSIVRRRVLRTAPAWHGQMIRCTSSIRARISRSATTGQPGWISPLLADPSAHGRTTACSMYIAASSSLDVRSGYERILRRVIRFPDLGPMTRDRAPPASGDRSVDIAFRGESLEGDEAFAWEAQ
jgi:hypothetical protein